MQTGHGLVYKKRENREVIAGVAAVIRHCSSPRHHGKGGSTHTGEKIKNK